jgi:hypothetical protein
MKMRSQRKIAVMVNSNFLFQINYVETNSHLSKREKKNNGKERR